MKMHVISSGSKGNASIIYDSKTTILVDMGNSYKRLCEGLKEINKSVNSIDYILYTHNHSDHVSGSNFLDSSISYCRVGTLQVPEKNLLDLYKNYQFGDFVVMPLLTSHDALAPCGFLFKDGKEKLLYLTDSGYIPDSTLKYMHNCDYYFIESNYDAHMLLTSSRPLSLKERIASEYGHLSNEQSAKYLVTLIGDKTKGIMLAHLSEECNTPNLALATYKNVFAEDGVSLKDINLVCANQWSSRDLC